MYIDSFLQIDICVENTWFKCKCQASDNVASVHQIKFTRYSFFLSIPLSDKTRSFRRGEKEEGERGGRS